MNKEGSRMGKKDFVAELDENEAPKQWRGRRRATTGTHTPQRNDRNADTNKRGREDMVVLVMVG